MSEKSNLSEVLTISQLASFLQCSKTSIYTKLYSGDLGIPYIKMGRMVRFMKSDVYDWLNSKRSDTGARNSIEVVS